MTITKKSIKVADEVIEILIKEECTVQEAEDILFGITQGIRKSSAVQRVGYQERFKDVLEQ